MLKNIAYLLRKSSFSRSFASEKDPTSWIRRLFNDKELQPEPFSNQEAPDYSAMVQNLENVSTADQQTFMKHLKEIHQEIHRTIVQSFENPNIRALMNSVRSETLCEMAIENFVGSINSPRNEFLMNLCMQIAENKAQNNQDLLLSVQFCKLYLQKLLAIQNGNVEAFKQCNEQLLALQEKGQPLACHIVAKEIYKVAMGLTSGKEKKNKKAMLAQAFEMFTDAAGKGSWQSFYYLGEMAQSGDIPGGVDLKYAFECYLLAASRDSPHAFFRLAQFYKDGMIDGKNPELEFYYTKKAAEMGVIEAQHNLACMYLEGRLCPYDSIKALAWFKHAGAHGFVHSNYNAAQMFMEGSTDGKVKKNYYAAVALLEEVKKGGRLDVEGVIQEIKKRAKSERDST